MTHVPKHTVDRQCRPTESNRTLSGSGKDDNSLASACEYAEALAFTPATLFAQTTPARFARIPEQNKTMDRKRHAAVAAKHGDPVTHLGLFSSAAIVA